MFRNYVMIALRGFTRDPWYALNNIAGLSLGLTCFIILGLYLESELTYDRHFENHENIYRVSATIENNGSANLLATVSRQLGPLLKQTFPEVREFVRFAVSSNAGRLILRSKDKKFYWDNVYLAEDNVFQVFSHHIVAGDPATALKDPLSIAISESVAKRYFGDADPIGQTLSTDTAAYHVTLVFQDLPENTHLRYNALLSYNRLAAFLVNVNVSQDLWNFNDFTYVVMPDHYDVRDFARISEAFYNQYMAEFGKQLAAGSHVSFSLERLADIHLKSRTEGDRPRGNPFYVYTFAAIALFVLLVACINYMNLATARSIRRAKEVGMRKVLGAHRLQLVGQFLGESIIYAVIALAVALVMVHLVLHYTSVSGLLGKSLSFDLVSRPLLLMPLGALALVVGLVSGIYPAFYLSAIRPIAALHGGAGRGGGRGGTLRRALVFLQFAISVGVIACTLLMAIQMHYVETKPLGFDKTNVVLVSMIGADLLEKTSFIEGDLASDPRIVTASLSQNIPGERVFTSLMQIEQEDGTNSTQTVRVMSGDENYLEAMGIELIDGRNFPSGSHEDMVFVNEALVKKMGWTQPIGKILGNDNFTEPVVGVVKDFHFQSLHEPVEPMYIFYNYVSFEGMDALNRLVAAGYLYVKLSGDDIPGALEFLQGKFAEYDPKHPFEYRFLDDILDQQYVSEKRQMVLIGIFAVVCILISCLGLFGLSAFTTSQRTKEIGVRKILGASSTNIVLLLFRDIVGLVLVASVVASIVSYYVISNWLAAFAYKAPINPVVFFAAAGLSLTVAFVTVAGQSWRTANANPALSLRYEG